MRSRGWTGWALGGVVVLLAAAATFGIGGRDPSTVDDQDAFSTVELSRMTLVDYEDASAQIGFGAVTTLRYLPPDETDEGGAGQTEDGLGLITWLAAPGSIVERGGTPFRVDDRPVVLLIGSLPMYRTLRVGVRGADVAQLEENLLALGYSGFTVDDEFTASTATAVRSFQRAVGLPQTGDVGPGHVLYAGGAVRIADHRRVVGDSATGDIVGVTGLTVLVTGAVDTSRVRHDIVAGEPVIILLPDGTEVPATVRGTGPPPADPQGTPPQEGTVLVEAEPVDGAALAGRDGAATLRFLVAERRDVLAVPVIALVALAEGGYGVQVVEEGATRYVAVTTGLFARGYVEITAGDLRAGMRIVVPASAATA